jgi:hypothetical protein
MGAGTLLTLLGLLVAAYAVLPSERRLDLKLRLTTLDWVVAGAALILIHCIQFYPTLLRLRLVPRLGPWPWGLTSENASYLIVLVAAGFISVRSGLAKVRPSTISSLRDLLERLLFEERFSEVLFLLARHLPALLRVYHQDYTLPRLRKRLMPEPWLLLPRSTSRSDRLRALVGRLVPSYEDSQSTAADIVRRLLLYEPFVSYLAKARPYLALSVFDHAFLELEEFLNLYLRALLMDTTSILFHEIKNNQNLSRRHRYHIPPENKLLHYLLADARVAEKLAVWKPLGDFAVEFLDKQFQIRIADQYNLPLGTYYEDGRWKCPLHVFVRFFDAMVLEALYQGITWHMWLYYFPPIVERIVRNLNPDTSTVDLSDEWPTPYHYLLYELFSAMIDWIEAAGDVPPDQENVVLKYETVDHENENVPKSAIIALGDCLRHVMPASNLDGRFKAYLLTVVLRSYFDLVQNPAMRPLSRVLRDVIVQGGRGHKDAKEYSVNLWATLNRVDRIPFLRFSEWDELSRRAEDRARR